VGTHTTVRTGHKLAELQVASATCMPFVEYPSSPPIMTISISAEPHNAAAG